MLKHSNINYMTVQSTEYTFIRFELKADVFDTGIYVA